MDVVARKFHEAVNAGELESVAEMLAQGVSVDAPDCFLLRPLHIAATRGNVEMVKALVARGCDVNARTACSDSLDRQPGLKQFLARHLALRLEFGEQNNTNFGVSPLHIATKYNFLRVAKVLVSAKANVNIEDSMKETPLFWAVAHGFEKIAKFLIEKGAAVNATNLDGATPLHWTAERGNVNLATLLIQNKAEIDAKDSRGLTPLHVSILSRQSVVSRFLINSGADVNLADNEGRTPLLTGAKSGYPVETANLLIEKGASVNARDKYGRTPIHLAAENDYADILYILINHKADINATDELMWTPLHFAAYEGNYDIVASLILMGAKVNERTHKNATPLHLAAHHWHIEVVNSLLQQKAQVNATDHINWTPLHFAVDESSTRHNLGQVGAPAQDFRMSTIKALIEYGADVNAKGSTDETALHVAVKYGNREVVAYLLENGAYYDVKTNSYFGSSSVLEMAAITKNVSVNALLRATETLFLAAKKGVCAEIEKCLKEGAPVNSRIVYGTPLLFASWKGHLDAVKVLLKNEADINLANASGYTPLHYAAKFGHYEILCLLLEHGAVYNARTKPGEKTPRHFAHEGGHKEAEDILEWIERMFIRVNIKDKTVIEDLRGLQISDPKFLAIKNCKNVNKETLAQIASKKGYEEVCKFF